jgi:hypothetical protein
MSVWSAVESRKAAVARTYKGLPGAPGHKRAHPFSGLLFCGVCGSKMIDAGGEHSEVLPLRKRAE